MTAFERNEQASLRTKLGLKEKHKLSTAEFDRLPSFNFLGETVGAMMLSSMNQAFNGAFDEMARLGKGTAELPKEAAESFYIGGDASQWNFKFAGLDFGRDLSEAERTTMPAKAYEALLEELILFRRGERKSDRFLVELDRRLNKSHDSAAITPLNWPEGFGNPGRPLDEQSELPFGKPEVN